jgi:hypothetical protein
MRWPSALYRLWAIAVLAWLGQALLFGWSWADVDEVKQVPKTVRDNPGSYRSHYSSYRRRHFWGK